MPALSSYLHQITLLSLIVLGEKGLWSSGVKGFEEDGSDSFFDLWVLRTLKFPSAPPQGTTANM